MRDAAIHSITIGGMDALSQLDACKSRHDLNVFLRNVCAEYRFQGGCLVRAPTVSDRKLSDIIQLSTLPVEFVDSHDREGIYAVCPLVPALRVSETSFDFEDRNFSVVWAGDKTRLVSDLYRRFNYAYFHVVPLHGAGGNNGALAFMGSRPKLSDMERATLGYISSHLKVRQAELMHHVRPSVRLTDRESECMSLTADGKTTSEIATILELSPHTVNHYINSVCVKLDCTNRTQAVAKALRTGMIN